MSESKNSGKKSIKKSKRQRSQKSKLESMSQETSINNKAEQALKAAEDLYRAVMENEHVMVNLIDSSYKIIAVNNAACRAFRKPASELIGRECFREFEKREAICSHCPGKKTMATGQMTEVETEGVRDDGSRFSVHIQTFPLIEPQGVVTGFIELIEDITERKKAELILQESKNLIRQVLDATPHPIFAKDRDGRYILVNKADAELHNTTPDAMVGKTDFDYARLSLASEQEVERFLSDDRMVIDSKQPKLILEETFTMPDGTIRWFQTTKVPVSLQGNNDCVLGVAIDITERKKAEQKLRDSEELYHAIFDQAADSVVLIDPETGEMVEFNDKAHEILGYTREEFKKLRLADLEVIESENEVIKHLQMIIKNGPDIFETKQRTKNGEERNLQVSARAISLHGKNLVQGIWRDITERKKAEQKLRDDRQQLRSLASELTLVEEREKRRIAGMLHDQISQSLVISKMRLESLCKSGCDKKVNATLKEICNSLGRTIKDMRSLIFRVSSPILEQLGFVEAVQDWLIEEIEKKQGIQTEFDDDGQHKSLDDDVSALLFRNVRELLINVVKHAHAKKVKVSIKKFGDKIKVCVEDDGIGFDPGKVVDKAVSKGGFGLFSIRQRMEQFGGNLEIKSEPRCGCKVTMTAPLKQELISEGE